MVAVEEAQRRTKRQRLTLAAIGLVLALVVAIVLVARAKSNGGSSASSTSTTTSGPTTSSGPSTSSTSTTVPGSVAGKPCVAMTGALPAGAPAVLIPVGPPPKQLVKVDYKIGTGAVVKKSATVTVNYIGVACSTGKIFDSSYSRKQPYVTSLDAVVPGWGLGIPGMRVGGERLLGIPPDLAYKSRSPGAGIAPDETLWFVIEVAKTS
jgi:peptidylprolyl isomerase